MVSVTQRVKAVKQPRGGYINPRSMERINFDDGQQLGPESISPITMGMVVEGLAYVMNDLPPEDAFHIGIEGAEFIGKGKYVHDCLSNIKGVDDESINNACKIVWFNQVVRGGIIPDGEYTGFADHQTCENIRLMIDRCKTFFDSYGPVIKYAPGFFFSYTEIVDRGDGDFITEDTFWDLKVSKNAPDKDDTLQLAMYYLMSKREIKQDYEMLGKIGIFNPRLNSVFILNMKDIDESTIKEIEKDVIGYDE